jgi:hypothetical protein
VRVAVFPEHAELARHLDAQLAGRDDDQRLRLLRPRRDEPEDGDRERGGLAGAGLGLSEQVAARLQDGDGLFLDGGRTDPAELGDGARDVGMDLEIAEAGGRCVSVDRDRQ